MLVVIFFIFGGIQAWDIRVIVALFVIAAVYYHAAGIPWHEVRSRWALVVVFLLLLLLLNTFITGGTVSGFTRDQLHVFGTVPVLGTPISAESISYAVAQFVRTLALVAVGFPVAFAIASSDFGATFAGLRVPYKFAYGLDLTFRFIPSIAVDLQTTLDAQRIRGLHEAQGGSPVAKLRRLVPVVVPLTVNTIVGAEDTIDAMDLRAFGTGPRTWLRYLRFDRIDKAIIAFFLGLAIVLTVAGFLTTSSSVYVFPFLIDLAGG